MKKNTPLSEINGAQIQHCPDSLTFEQAEDGTQYRLFTCKASVFLKGRSFPFESYGQGKSLLEAQDAAHALAVELATQYYVEQNNEAPATITPEYNEKKEKIVDTLSPQAPPASPVHPAELSRDEHPTTVEVPTNPSGYFFAIAKERGLVSAKDQRLFLGYGSRSDVTDERFQECAEALQHWGVQEMGHLFDVINAPDLVYLKKAWVSLPQHMGQTMLFTKDYMKTILPQ